MTKAKKMAWLISVLVLLGLCMPWAQAAEYTGTINTNQVFFRTSPTTKAAFHWQFDAGDRVTVTGTSGDFYAVKADGAVGYVMKKFVTVSQMENANVTVIYSRPGMEGITSIDDIDVPAVSQKGDEGPDVIALQQALTLFGFYHTTIDGDYGYNTVQAVKEFQEFHELTPDGVAGEATIRALFGKKPANAASAKATAKPVATKKPTTNTGKVNSLADLPVPAPCEYNDKSEDVKILQQALTLRGYYHTTIDSHYGYQTKLAVQAFQRAQGLTADGIAGEATIRALFGKSAAGTQTTVVVKATATPKPASSGRKGMEGITKISDIKVPAVSKQGDSGENVKALQQALTLKGFYNTTIDGDYGQNTVKAVKAFQKSVGLSQDGVAGAVTIKLLFGQNAKATTAVKATATPKPVASTIKGMEGITKISDIEVPTTSKKGDKGENVKALQQALTLKGFYNSTIDGSYGENTVKAVKAFQKSKGMSQDGVAGAVTIKGLFGKNPKATATPKPTPKPTAKPTPKPTPKPTAKPTATPKTYKTEQLDWFNGGANKIPRGATFQVKDVATGKVFTVRRWAGANHIDAEPKTASDTATMKAIYGGSWSWSRRAVLVKYNGHVYAGSMNGMPHGTSTIGNNNFDGHFCIHFYKSKTHETKRVDPDHQNAVARAMRATW